MANVASKVDKGQVVITIKGDFVFDVNSEFREAYKKHPSHSRFLVDLSRANYMDSAGLGMLLQLREHAGGDQSRVAVRGFNDVIRDIFKVANFHRLFDLGV